MGVARKGRSERACGPVAREERETSMFCPNCGAKNPEGARFCRICGASFGATRSAGTAGAAASAAPAAGTPAGTKAPAGTGAATPAVGTKESNNSATAKNAKAAGATPHAPSTPNATTHSPAAAGTPASTSATPKPGATTQPGAAPQASPIPRAAGPVPPYAAPAPGATTHAAGTQPGTAPKLTLPPEVAKLLDHAKALPMRTKAIVGGAAAAVLALILVLVFVANGEPSKSQIEQDIRATGITKNDSSSSGYTSSADFTINDIRVTNKRKDAIPQYVTGLTGASGDAYTYTVEAKMSNDSVEATKTIEATYVKYQGKWTTLSTPAEKSSTYTPKTGPSNDAIVKNASGVIVKGNSNLNYLNTLYQNGSFDVTQNDLDGTTANVTLHCKKDGTFATAEGNVYAVFKFDTTRGTWNIDSATADDSLDEPDYSKLVGTWKGTFKSQSSYGRKCFGAQNQEFTVTITSVDSGSLKAEGSFSGLAHYHTASESDENSDPGDTMLKDQKFTIALQKNPGSLDPRVLTGSYDMPEDSNGKVSLELDFGSTDDANKVTAKLETTPHTDSIFSYARFTDTYELQKQS